jgi:hypothetical protein
MNMERRDQRRQRAPVSDQPNSPPVPNEEAMLERMRLSALVQTKGQASLRPREVHREAREGEDCVLFYFDRGELRLAPNSKEVIFTLRMGMMGLKAKFVPKDMTYKSQLAL